jgi:hypothetical protein
MKVMVKLAVLIASLLLVTGVAFAGVCYNPVCYSVDGINVSNPAGNFTGQIWLICLGSTPASISVIPSSPPLSSPAMAAVFTDGLFLQAVGYSPVFPAGNGIYMKFHGSDDGIFNGIFSPDGIMEYRLHGIRVGCPA